MSSAEWSGLIAEEADARVKAWTPLWRTASRAEATAILRTTRDVTDSLIDGVPAKGMEEIGPLGGGAWSLKDFIGHLASVEEAALVVLGVRRSPSVPEPRTTAEINALRIARKRAWSLARVRKDAAAVRNDLMNAIAEATDARWLEKVDTARGRSALGLVLGKVLTGEKYGYYAHDLAHYKDLKRATASK